jgi:hypothetical protein
MPRAVTFAFSVAVNRAFNSSSMVARRRSFPHHPSKATSPAMANGIIQTGNLKRAIITVQADANTDAGVSSDKNAVQKLRAK